MPLDLPAGSDCFIDTNVFVYHFTSHESEGVACTDFLRRVAGGEVRAAVSAPVLADALHKVMLAEVRARHEVDRAGLVAWIQRHRERLSELTQTLAACDQIERLPLDVLPVDVPLLRQGMRLSAAYGLLTGDALIVALMQRHGLTHLVTNDDDFDGIPDLTVWKPR
jgi:predicted nucleic acid-binding protein